MNMIDKELFKVRSFSACLKSAFLTFCDNFGVITRNTWTAALVFALLNGLAYMIPEVDFHAKPSAIFVPLVLSVLSAIAGILVLCWLSTRFVMLLRGGSLKQLYMHNLKLAGIYVALWLVYVLLNIGICSLLTGLLKWVPATLTGMLAISTADLLVFCMACLPLVYTGMRYVVEENVSIREVFGRPYRMAWRYAGFMFITVFVTLIVLVPIIIVLGLPLHVLILAEQSNALGMALGDASGLPENFCLLEAAVSVAVGFLMAYVLMWVMLVNYYIYTSVESRMKGKDKDKADADKAVTK